MYAFFRTELKLKTEASEEKLDLPSEKKTVSTASSSLSPKCSFHKQATIKKSGSAIVICDSTTRRVMPKKLELSRSLSLEQFSQKNPREDWSYKVKAEYIFILCFPFMHLLIAS